MGHTCLGWVCFLDSYTSCVSKPREYAAYGPAPWASRLGMKLWIAFSVADVSRRLCDPGHTQIR